MIPSKKQSERSKQNKGQNKHMLAKEVLTYLLIGGILTVAVSFPYLAVAAIPVAQATKRGRSKKQYQNTFDYLRRQGLISVESKRGEVHMKLTEKGEKRALRDALVLRLSHERKPMRWDGKWRILLFDISVQHNLKRNALRHLLKKVGFVQLQQSVWIYPYNCSKEVKWLKTFFELDDTSCRLVVTETIGNDVRFKKHFSLK